LQRILFIWKFWRLRVWPCNYLSNWLLFVRISSLKIIFTIIQSISISEWLLERIISNLNISLAFLKNILRTFDYSTKITYNTFTIIIRWEIWAFFWIFIQLYFASNHSINMIDNILILFDFWYIFRPWVIISYLLFWSAETFWVCKSVVSYLTEIIISIMTDFSSLLFIL